MKPLPNLDDEQAMLQRGRRSALAAARSDAMIELRDAYTALDCPEWAEFSRRLPRVKAAVLRLETVDILWGHVHDQQPTTETAAQKRLQDEREGSRMKAAIIKHVGAMA